MARVNTQAMHTALDELMGAGYISGWQKRPLGIYWIGRLFDDEGFKPDTKEAALWTMGASYSFNIARMLAAANADEATPVLLGQVAPPPLTEKATFKLELGLDGLSGSPLLESWEHDPDGDYVLHLRDGETLTLYARDALQYATGANHMLHALAG